MTETEGTTPALSSAISLAVSRLQDGEERRVEWATWIAVAEQLPHPYWCTSVRDDEDPSCAPSESEDGRRLHRGPTFGGVVVYGNEDMATGAVTFDPDVEAINSNDPAANIRMLRQLIDDAKSALKWIEAHR